MLFASDNTMRASEALRQLLHYRMRITSAIGSFICLGSAIRNLADATQRSKQTLFTHAVVFVTMLVLGAIFVLLSRLRNLSLVNLRRIETLGLTVALATVISIAVKWLDNGLELSNAAPAGVVSGLQSKIWAVYPNGAVYIDRAYKGLTGPVEIVFGLPAVIYGVLIPNTWRRCLVVMLIFIVTAELCVLRAGLQIPALRLYLVEFLFGVFRNVGSLAAVGLYGCYKLTVLREEAQAAREVGQYVLGEKLGQGGMGVVYRARHRLLRRPCAVKLIRAEQTGSPNTLVRFEREVQATAQLTHPNTIEIYDYGRTDDGTLYYAMEYLPGLSLDLLVRRYGVLSPGRLVYLMRQVCRALHEAHGAGLIHRDIKPGNIHVTERGGEYDVVKLLDFGLVAYHVDLETPPDATKAEAADGSGGDSKESHITGDGHILGTPAFMSPEQAQGIEVEARSDLYSLGCVAYFALVGRAPFDRPTVAASWDAHINVPPPRPSETRAAVPADLDAIILRCLAKHKEERYASARELEDALANCQFVPPGVPLAPSIGGATWTDTMLPLALQAARRTAAMKRETLRLPDSPKLDPARVRYAWRDQCRRARGASHAEAALDLNCSRYPGGCGYWTLAVPPALGRTGLSLGASAGTTRVAAAPGSAECQLVDDNDRSAKQRPPAFGHSRCPSGSGVCLLRARYRADSRRQVVGRGCQLD